MLQLDAQQKIFEFLDEEFSKIKDQILLKYPNKKLKPQVIEKKIKKLQRDIELILKTDSFNNVFHLKMLALKTEITNYCLQDLYNK